VLALAVPSKRPYPTYPPPYYQSPPPAYKKR
jgi:hypothetical protein